MSENQPNCAIKTGNCAVKIQPAKRARFLKFNFASAIGKNIVTIGSKAVLKVYDETLITKLVAKDKKWDLNDLQIISGCGTVFNLLKVAAESPALFDKDIKIISLQGDSERVDYITFSDFYSEYAFKNNFLTLPVSFMLDNRNVLIWELPMPVNAGDELKGTITLTIQKIIGQVYNLPTQA